jgi:hypothetical protein
MPVNDRCRPRYKDAEREETHRLCALHLMSGITQRSEDVDEGNPWATEWLLPLAYTSSSGSVASPNVFSGTPILSIMLR